MRREPREHLTYLLRLWRSDDPEHPTWRAALENPRTGERWVFRDLAALHAFLEARTNTLLQEEQTGC